MRLQTCQTDDLLDLCRLRAERFCTDPEVWQSLAKEYRQRGRFCMAAYCEDHARHYAGKEAQESVEDRTIAP